MTSILFVCLGNICRSCTAEEIFRTLTERNQAKYLFKVDSAGLIDYHEGELPDIRMRQHAARHGYDLTHRSRPIREVDFDRFDWIVGMDGQNRERLLRLAATEKQRKKIIMMADFLTHHPEQTTIPDPYYGGDEGFELVIDLLEDACQGLLDKLAEG